MSDQKLPILRERLPSWLHRRLPSGMIHLTTEGVVSQAHLHTVCEEARCPNLSECWSKGTATFLVMGKECTRSCGFCSIDFSKTPKPLDKEEPLRVALSAKALALSHVVITQVARDDLPDGGADHLCAVIQAVRKENPFSTVEVLTSDFAGNTASWERVIQESPDIVNHNIETVRDLTPRVRHKATYERTLDWLKYMAEHRHPQKTWIKSGLMLGLGETESQVFETLIDLKEAGCEIVTLGQYLQPIGRKLTVKAFVPPEQFKKLELFGRELGFLAVYAGPFVRSSYNAALLLKQLKEKSHG